MLSDISVDTFEAAMEVLSARPYFVVLSLELVGCCFRLANFGMGEIAAQLAQSKVIAMEKIRLRDLMLLLYGLCRALWAV